MVRICGYKIKFWVVTGRDRREGPSSFCDLLYKVTMIETM